MNDRWVMDQLAEYSAVQTKGVKVRLYSLDNAPAMDDDMKLE